MAQVVSRHPEVYAEGPGGLGDGRRPASDVLSVWGGGRVVECVEDE